MERRLMSAGFRRVASVVLLAVLGVSGAPAPTASAQMGAASRIEGRLLTRGRHPGNVRIRLILQDGLRPVGETMSQTDGRFEFNNLIEGNYVIEVEETAIFQAARATLELRKLTD